MHHNERIPNVQTIDDLLIEKCQPGDVILFDRRCECCASGAMAALACVLGKAALCNEDDGTRSVEKGSYEHCGELLVKIMFILNKTISRTVHSAMNWQHYNNTGEQALWYRGSQQLLEHNTIRPTCVFSRLHPDLESHADLS